MEALRTRISRPMNQEVDPELATLRNLNTIEEYQKA